MREWDNRVQVSPEFIEHIQDMLDGFEHDPDAVRVHQNDKGPNGQLSFTWDVQQSGRGD